MADVRRFVRDNVVIIAAFVLPAVVAALFIVATAIPRFTVPLPQHDLVFRIEHYGSPPSDVSVEFVVPNGRLEAVVRPIPKAPNPAMGAPYAQRWALLLFDHQAKQVREIPFELPRDIPEGESRTVVIDQLARRRVIPGSTAPDGYNVSSLNTGGGSGIVGELFGMNRNYRRGIAISKNGRTIELELPPPHRESYAVIFPIGWVQ